MMSVPRKTGISDEADDLVQRKRHSLGKFILFKLKMILRKRHYVVLHLIIQMMIISQSMSLSMC